MILRATLLTAFTIPNAWGYCEFTFNDSIGEIRNYAANGPSTESVTTPRDLADKPTIYEESLPVKGGKMIIICPTPETLGFQLNSAIGAQPAMYTSLFRLKDSGIALQFFLDYGDAALVPLQFSALKLGARAVSIQTNSPTIRIVQTGPIKDGIVIPAGLLGKVMSSDGQTFATFNLTKTIRIVGGACITPDVDVDMGHTTLTSDFKKVGSHADPVGFNIQLRDCPNFLNAVKYSIKANTSVLDATNGIVSLDATSSAQGVGLQVKRDNDQPVVFGTEYTFSEYNRAGGNFVIPFSAAYTRVSPAIKAGAANSSLTFTMSYQ